MNAPHPSVWIERLTLTNFRNYANLTLEAGLDKETTVVLSTDSELLQFMKRSRGR